MFSRPLTFLSIVELSMANYALNIASFIQLADGVLRICNHFITAAKDAPRDMVIVSGEVTSLRAILFCLRDAHLNPKTADALPSLFTSDGPVAACYNAISELNQLLPAVPAGLIGKSTFRLSHLTWALHDGQIRKLLAEVNVHKSTLLLAITGDLM